MQLETTITSGAPQQLFQYFGQAHFAKLCVQTVLSSVLEVEEATERPAEFNVLVPKVSIPLADSTWGVHVQLTGVSRADRTIDVFNKALEALRDIVYMAVMACLGPRERAQIFVMIMLDGEIETAPGLSSSFLESEATWAIRRATD